MKRLLIDVGNTASKFALLENDELSHVLTVLTKELDNKIIKAVGNDYEDIIVSSVVPEANKKLTKLFKGKDMRFITPRDDSGAKINIDNPDELGTDLLCDIAGALDSGESLPFLVVDLGTATKFLYIDENKEFYSCAILPGLELSLLSLSNGTALLPNVKVAGAKKILDCHNTIDVLTASAYYSAVDTINGMLARYQQETNKDIKVIVTGGYIDLLKKDFNFAYKHIPNLALHGIKAILNRGA